MTLEEKLAQLDTDTPAIPRLTVPSYHWRNNVLHGTVDNGVSTQFPQSVGMAASFDVGALHAAARVMSDEQRVKHNIKLKETGGNSVMDYGLDFCGGQTLTCSAIRAGAAGKRLTARIRS